VSVFGVVLTVVVLVGVAIFILVFERKRARQIEHDLRDMANEQGDVPESRRPEE
jgi:hypothetical protein